MIDFSLLSSYFSSFHIRYDLCRISMSWVFLAEVSALYVGWLALCPGNPNPFIQNSYIICNMIGLLGFIVGFLGEWIKNAKIRIYFEHPWEWRPWLWWKKLYYHRSISSSQLSIQAFHMYSYSQTAPASGLSLPVVWILIKLFPFSRYRSDFCFWALSTNRGKWSISC